MGHGRPCNSERVEAGILHFRDVELGGAQWTLVEPGTTVPRPKDSILRSFLLLWSRRELVYWTVTGRDVSEPVCRLDEGNQMIEIILHDIGFPDWRRTALQEKLPGGRNPNLLF